jgi:hypothetical protein
MLALLTAFVFAALLAGRGGTRDPPPEGGATVESLVIAEALGSAEAERELEQREKTLQARVDLPRFGFRSESRELMAIARLRDFAINERFRKTPFDEAVGKLPFRKPPLRVLQWVLTDRSHTLDSRADRERFYRLSERAQTQWLTPKPEHKLYARVNEAEFYAMSEGARAKAVKVFYRSARRLFQHEGIRDFVLVVTPLTEALEHLPAFAVGRDGSASLTPLGRARPGPGV